MRKKALSLLLALTLCLMALTPAAALDTGDAPEQTAAQGQTVSGGQETTAGGQDASVSEEQEEPASEEEEAPASEEEPEEPAPEEQEAPASEQQEEPASEEEQPQPAEEEPEQPAAAPAAEPALLAAANGIATYSGDTHTPHNICGDEGCTEHGGKDAEWIAISDAYQLFYAGTSGGDSRDNPRVNLGTADAPCYCYLTEDITLSSDSWEPFEYVVLCLNGHKITTGSSDSCSVITVTEDKSKTFTLCDCGGGQIVQPSQYNKGGVKVEGGTFNLYGGTITKDNVDSPSTIGVCVSSGTFNMYGGAISGNYTAGEGGGVRVESGGIFELYGGSITNNLAVGSYPVGGGVYVKGGTFNMHGGSITNNNAGATGCKGGGVCVDNGGTFNMSGGSISGNNAAATSNSKNGKGGGVYVKASGTFNMSGGTICGNTANDSSTQNDAIDGGGGVYVEASGTFTVSGNANISGNKVGATSAAATTANNVYLAGSAQTITVGGKLNDGARIGVAGKSLGAVVAVPSSDVTLTESDAAKFVSDKDGMYRGQLSDDKTSVVLASVFHEHCIYGETNCTDTENHGSSRGFGSELWMDPSGTLWIGNTMLNVTTASNESYYELAAGSSSGTATYYLGSDLDLQYPLYITQGTVRLCLNGHELKLTPINEYSIYSVITLQGSSVNLNLTDCKDSGKVTHADGKKGSGVNLKSASYSQNIIFNMYGGSITGNTASGRTSLDSGDGGGVYMNSGTVFNMYGGSITGNTATDNGGGVYVSGSKFNMYGGTIGGSTTESANSASKGGGVYVANGSEFTMSGGKITGNTATSDGGGVFVILNNSAFKVSGDVTITDNKVGGADNNVYLPSGKTITVDAALGTSAGIGVTTADAPGDGSPITVAKPSSSSSYVVTGSDKSRFSSDNSAYEIQLSGSDLVLAVPSVQTHEHYLCGKDPCVKVGDHAVETGKTTFETALTQDTDGNLLAGGTLMNTKTVGYAVYYELEGGKNYYLGSDLNLKYPIYITSGTVSLCLNGCELKLTPNKDSFYDVIHFAGSATLNLTDCEPNGEVGTITHSMKDANDRYVGRGVAMYIGSTLNLYGGNITGNDSYSYTGSGVDAYGKFNMYGGSITNNTTGLNTNGGGVYVEQTGVFNMYAGTISGNTATDNGGGVYVKDGTFAMSGGTVSGNGGQSGGGVYVKDGTLDLSGGTVTGNTADGGCGGGVYNDGTLTVSGDARITGNTLSTGDTDNVYLPTDKTITVSAALGDSACIGVTVGTPAPGTVVAEPESGVTLGAEDVQKFPSDVSECRIVLSGGKLVVADDEPAATHTHYLCGGTTCTMNDHADTRTTFEKPISGIADLTQGMYANVKQLTEGSYYLTGDLELGNYILDIYGGVTLCLNGYSITSTRTDGAVIRVSPDSRTGYSTAVLMLSDCRRGGTEYGKITSDNKGAYGVYVSGGGSFFLFGGEITGNTARNGGGVCVAAGGVEPSYRAHFTMYGGRIAGNAATQSGGGVYVGGNCTFTMSGGEITGNTAAQSGGGVYAAASGGVGYDAAVFTVFGSAKVTGSTVDSKANNVYLHSEVALVVDDNGLRSAAEIGVTTETAPGKNSPVTIATNTNDPSDVNQIISDNGSYEVQYNEKGTLQLALSGRADAGVTITSAPTAKTYGDGNFTVTASAANPGTGGMWKPWRSSNTNVLDIVKEDGGTVTVKVVGAGKATLTATYDSATSYGTAVTAEITVSPATVTVTAKNQSIYVDGTVPDLSSPKAGTHYTVAGLVGNDALTGTVALNYQKDGKAVTPDASKAGTYTIAVSGVSEPQNGNYNPIVLKDGTLTVSNRSTGGGGGGGGASVPTYPVSAPGASAGTTVGAAAGGSVSASAKNAAAGSTVSITVSPDAGYRLGKLSVVDKNGKEIEVTEKDGKYTFTMPASQVEIQPVFEKIPTETAFPDVPSSAYYAEPVKWAAEKGITSGTRDGGFAPGNTCTRAQIVTFLWRAAGSPEPKTAQTGMTDISPEAYYAKAVAWAIENGITVGKTDTTFDPNGTCTRANGVTFLYRAAKAAAAGGDTGFRDVAADAYYAAAVRWALENGITNGLGSGLFGPNGGCTRAQIVTFLYRLYVKA